VRADSRAYAQATVALAFVLTVATPPAHALEPLVAEFQAKTYTTYDQDSPAVSPLANGQFVVVWESGSGATNGDGDESGVFAQRFATNGARVSSEFQINVYTSGRQEDPSVAARVDGSFIVVWDSALQDGSGEGVFARRYTAAGEPESGEFRVNSYTTNFQTYPAIAAVGDGFVVVWESFGQDGSHGGIFGQFLGAAGDAVGTEFRINTYTTDFQRFPSVAGNANGEFVVVWESEPQQGGVGQDGSDAGIFGQRYAADGSPEGAEFQLNSYTTDRQTLPDVVVADDGSFLVVWEGRMPLSTVGADEVSLRRYDADGAPIGTEGVVNTYRTAFEEDVSIARSGSGFLVTWETEAGGSIGDDSSGESVVARELSAEGVPVGAETQVNTYTTGDQSDPVVASAGSSFVVAWRSSMQDGSDAGVFGQLMGRALVCGDATGDGKKTASDALQALRTAIGTGNCFECVCDVNGSGGINTTDALILLHVGVGQSITLTCPPC
jgi:hypothetical protein